MNDCLIKYVKKLILERMHRQLGNKKNILNFHPMHGDWLTADSYAMKLATRS